MYELSADARKKGFMIASEKVLKQRKKEKQCVREKLNREIF